MLGRHWEAQRIADSLAASLQVAEARLLFMVNENGGTRCRRACAATGADVSAVEGPRRPGDYARKINAAVGLTREPWIFTGASDLVFHPGWLDAALAVSDHGPPGVVGTQDRGNPLVKRGRMSTHSLVARTYVPLACIDQPGNLYCDLYDHNYCDMELVDYARVQRRWIFAQRSVVEHLHPDWRKAKMDATYQVSKRGMRDDQKLWMERQKMWRLTPQQLRLRQRRELRR